MSDKQTQTDIEFDFVHACNITEVKNKYEMIVSVFAKILLYQNFSRILALL